MKSIQFLSLFCFSLTLASCASASQAAHTSKSTHVLSRDLCQEGTTQQGFLFPITSGDIPCAEGTQTCISGQWQGPELFQTCENFTKSCEGHPHGSAVTGYLQMTSQAGVPCMPATKTCINGSWTGPEVFEFCTEL